MSIKDQILNAQDQQSERVEVPEWGKEGQPLILYVRGMTASERDVWESERVLWKNLGQKNQRAEQNIDNVRAGLVARTLVDEDGNRIFEDGDIAKLGAKSAKVIDGLFEVAQKLSGISDDDLDELEKNSEAVHGGSTVTRLPIDGKDQRKKS